MRPRRAEEVVERRGVAGALIALLPPREGGEERLRSVVPGRDARSPPRRDTARGAGRDDDLVERAGRLLQTGSLLLGALGQVIGGRGDLVRAGANGAGRRQHGVAATAR